MSRVRVVGFDFQNREGLAEALARQLQRRLGVGVEIGDRPVELASCYAPLRGQYDGRGVLEAVALEAGAGRILALTDADLFLSVFTHVLGAAQLDGAAAVVSTHRLRPEAMGLPPDPALVEDRLVKEAVHELGHTFGLRHCQDPACAMFSANNPDEVDLRGAKYRGNCLALYHEKRKSL